MVSTARARGRARTGKPIKEHRLTLTGLYAAIKLSGDVDRVVEKWKDLDPLIFGKWRLLTGAVPAEEAAEALKRASMHLFTTLYYDEKGKLITDGPILQYALRSHILDHVLTRPIPSLQKWMEALRLDDGLREFAISYLRQRIFNKQYQACLGEEVLKVLKGLKRELSLEGISENARRKVPF